MKVLSTVILIICLQCTPQLTSADESEVSLDILAKRGNGIVTQDQFDARAAKIPDAYRLQTLRDRNRFRDILNGMLLNSQLATDAREAGYEADELVIERMKLAAENELAAAWLQHYIKSQPAADFEALAQEYYQLHKDQMLSPSRIDVTHILVSTKERSEEEALVLANALYAEVIENPSSFSEVALMQSEDPSASSNKGSFKGVKRGDMVPPFENKAFSLEPGEISEPVKTRYGYHIIRLDAYIAQEVLAYDSVKDQLIESERKAHQNRIESDYRDRLTSYDVEMSQENLEEMIRRQFGEDYVDPHTNSEKLE